MEENIKLYKWNKIFDWRRLWPLWWNKKKTQAKNEQFLQETKSIDERLIAFELILKREKIKIFKCWKNLKIILMKQDLYGIWDNNRRFLQDLFYYI